ncbi:MAG: hypothetical protein IPO03_19235 [Bacteroidetes bacterium]|nr:hypothetical protein [Bacteroidota bacterium]
MDKQSAVVQKGFIFSLLIFYLASCNNPIGTDLPKENPETADCYFPPANGGGIGTGYNYIFDEISFKNPYFNPNNPDEFIYLENGDLIKYCISENKKSVIYQPINNINYQPKWSRNGKIAFNTSDNNIWIIDDTGANPTKITNIGVDISINYYGEFSYTGDSLLFHTVGSYEDGDSRKTRIAYDNYSKFDTLQSIDVSPTTNWQKPGYLLDIWFSSATCINLFNPDVFNTFSFGDTMSEGGVIWEENKIDFYCYRGDGIYKGNIISNTFIKIKDMCPFVYYLYPCYSEISKKVISEKVTKEYIGSNTVYVKYEIITMNPDGSDEHIILPQ